VPADWTACCGRPQRSSRHVLTSDSTVQDHGSGGRAGVSCDYLVLAVLWPVELPVPLLLLPARGVQGVEVPAPVPGIQSVLPSVAVMPVAPAPLPLPLPVMPVVPVLLPLPLLVFPVMPGLLLPLPLCPLPVLPVLKMSVLLIPILLLPAPLLPLVWARTKVAVMQSTASARIRVFVHVRFIRSPSDTW
jgi:hypothetical protein